MLLSLILIGCSTTPTTSSKTDGPQLRVTIANIPPDYNGKLGWLVIDTGSSRDAPTVAWAMGNINNGSLSLNILDWKTDKPYNKTGNYFLTFIIYEDFAAAGTKQSLWDGIIMSKDIGEDTYIELSEFTKV
jgi:hypothetical protein